MGSMVEQERRDDDYDEELDLFAAGESIEETVANATLDGSLVVTFLVQMMLGDYDGVRPADRIAAARELLDRGYGRAYVRDPASAGDGVDDDATDIMQLLAMLSGDEEGGDAEE